MFSRLRTLFETRSTSRSWSLKDWPATGFFGLFGGVQTTAGVPVGPESALRSPTVLACVRVISETLGGLPIHLFRRGADGSRERETSHPAAQILAGDWTPWCGGVESRIAMQLDALLHGAGYGHVIKTSDGTPREIHRLDPVCVAREVNSPEPLFRVQQGNGQEQILSWREVLYVPTPGSAGHRLLSIVNLAREAIGIDLAMNEHQARIFSNGARPSGMFKYDKFLSPQQFEILRQSLQQRYAGQSSGQTMILEGGMSFEPLQYSSVDLQFLELRRLAHQEIARAFKVPSTLVGDLDRAVWRNVEELSRQFVAMCLLPWSEIWQASLERVLLTPEERSQYFIEFAFDDLTRADLAARFTAYRQATGGSWLTPNEIRALDNRKPLPGGDELIRQAGQSDTGQDATNQQEDANVA